MSYIYTCISVDDSLFNATGQQATETDKAAASGQGTVLWEGTSQAGGSRSQAGGSQAGSQAGNATH